MPVEALNTPDLFNWNRKTHQAGRAGKLALSKTVEFLQQRVRLLHRLGERVHLLPQLDHLRLQFLIEISQLVP